MIRIPLTGGEKHVFVILLMPIVFFAGVGYMCEENMVGERI